MSTSLQDLNPGLLRALLRWLGGDKAIELEIGEMQDVRSLVAGTTLLGFVGGENPIGAKVAERFEFAIVDRDIAGAARGGFRRISNAYARVHAIMVANTMGLSRAQLAIVYNGIADHFATEAAKIEALLTPAEMASDLESSPSCDPLDAIAKATKR